MEEKFLSRKHRRKKERREKQEKKNAFYRQKYQKINGRKTSFNSKTNSHNDNGNENTSNLKLRENSIDSFSHYSDEENSLSVMETGKGNQMNRQKNKRKESDDFDKEIAYLEKKLDLKSKDKAMIFNKKLVNENYDPDLIGFLDNITAVVNQDLTAYENPEMPKTKREIKAVKPPNPTKESNDDFRDKPQSVLRKESLTQTDSEGQNKFHKELTFIINKIAESNISFLFPELYSKIKAYRCGTKSLYEAISSISLKLLLNQEITNLPITSCICSIISLLHYRLGNNFMLFYMKSLFNAVDNLSNEQMPKHKVKNFILEIIHFFILGNITSVLIYDLIRFFIEHFNEAYSEYLLLLLSYTGIEIRKEAPGNLKDIIIEINKKYNTLKISNTPETSKIKYIVDMIDDIKHNKYLKFNLSDKFNFFKTFVSHQSNAEIKKGETMEISLASINAYNLNDSSGDSNNDGREEGKNNDLLQAIANYDLPDDLLDEKQSKLAEAKMKQMNISTQLKKTIFIAITNAYDINDAFERLTRMNLNKEQNREIIKMLIQLCYEERSYNPFYKCLLEKLMAVNKDHKYTYHYCIWDYMKIMHTFKAHELKKIHNLAKLTSQLLANEKISLPVFLHFKFDDEGDENSRIFFVFAFDFYFEFTTATKAKILFAKLVKNDEHVEFAQRLLQFLIKDFTKEIDVESKSEGYQENMSATIKVLNQIKPVAF